MASATRTRKRNPRGEGERLRAALMEATVELLVEHGSTDQLSIRAVTSRAGVSPTALYLHFADKQELLRAVCDEAFEELIAFLGQAAASQDGDARGELEAMGAAYLAFARQRPALYRVLFATPGRFGGGERPPEQDPGKRALQALVEVTARAVPENPDPLGVALQLWTGLHGFVSLKSVMPEFGHKMEWPGDEQFLHGLVRAHLG
ncbi:MAG TPA: TetR/AcrR family transcriptional regulator [Solirubrobacteraceae bacterium]|jgi:AcrR family transcriptional regulator|nr:TetR/AcrR family transcriptional regulator [Solirubrobacteraceae bacterium]